MRVEENGRYAMFASKAGSQGSDLVPQCQSEPDSDCSGRRQGGNHDRPRVHGTEREHWWKLAVEAHPPYAVYQTRTDQVISAFVIE